LRDLRLELLPLRLLVFDELREYVLAERLLEQSALFGKESDVVQILRQGGNAAVRSMP